MSMRCYKPLILAVLGILLLGGMSGARAAAGDRPVLIFADLSGSSQVRLGYFNSPDKDVLVWTTKAQVLKEILTLFARNLPADYCPIGLFEMRYLPGDNNYYAPVIPLAAYKSCDLLVLMNGDLTTETPLFNRRTPLADGLRQADENILGPSGGHAVILLISDGRENIRCRGNANKDEKEPPQKDDPVGDPLAEVARLKLEYGDKIVLHAIGLESGSPEDQDGRSQEGLALLQKITAAAGGRYFSGRDLFQHQEKIADLYPLLCAGQEPEPAVKAIIEETPLPVVAAPLDSDGDGVFDNDDRCPGTPKGAHVNAVGCWVLGAWLFDTDRWEIKPEGYAELENVASILRKNPELKIEIQGHTDNQGSLAYNQILSEKRAGAVKQHLLKLGISEDRLSTVGFSYRNPVATNATPDGRTLNRRVELNPNMTDRPHSSDKGDNL